MTAAPAFSLSEGGRLHEALVRAGLTGGPGGRLKRIAFLIAACWIPMAVLAATNGTFQEFATDLGPLVRFFLVVPVAVLAEPFADRVLGRVIGLFRASGLVPEGERDRFEESVARTSRQATNDTAEATLLVIALVAPHLFAASAHGVVAQREGWVLTPEGALTGAARWYAWVGLPLVEFLVLRWLWRTIAWWRLMWRTARLPLSVTPAHPDRCAGLGFLALAPTAFVPFFVSLSLLASVGLADQLRFQSIGLVAAAPLIGAFLLVQVVLLIVPQLFFIPLLGTSRRAALQQYALTGMAIARRFDGEWAQRPVPAMQELLDSPHASIMTDFAATYGLIDAMRPVPLSAREILQLLVPLILPFLPLLLFEYSAKELFTQLLQLVR